MARYLMILITAVSICISLLIIDSKECKADQTIKLGVAGAYSGEVGKVGIPMLRAAEMVVKRKRRCSWKAN